MKEKTLLGIFDSGVGGFSVLKEIRKVTTADILYFGDCAHAPYGNRSETEIVGFIKDIFVSLRDKGVTYFVSACNSMSVHTTEKLLTEIGIPQEKYIDMIQAVKLIPFAVDSKVLIIATQATIASSVYQTILSGKGVLNSVYVPVTLAQEVEAGDNEAVEVSIHHILNTALSINATHVLFACTHYPLVEAQFKAVAYDKKWDGVFIDPSVYVAKLVALWNLKGTRNVQLETSKETAVFKSYQARVW